MQEEILQFQSLGFDSSDNDYFVVFFPAPAKLLTISPFSIKQGSGKSHPRNNEESHRRRQTTGVILRRQLPIRHRVSSLGKRTISNFDLALRSRFKSRQKLSWSQKKKKKERKFNTRRLLFEDETHKAGGH